ncbi:MAG: MerC domain-containing protein [Acidiferrobacterales bacterium]
MFKQIFGSAGSTFAGACCLGFAPFLAGLSAIGAGFLVNDLVLIPLFVIFLGFTLWTLWKSRKAHGQSGPFYLGAVGGVTAFATLWFFTPLAYVGLAAVIAASVWDIVLARQCEQACETG